MRVRTATPRDAQRRGRRQLQRRRGGAGRACRTSPLTPQPPSLSLPAAHALAASTMAARAAAPPARSFGGREVAQKNTGDASSSGGAASGSAGMVTEGQAVDSSEIACGGKADGALPPLPPPPPASEPKARAGCSPCSKKRHKIGRRHWRQRQAEALAHDAARSLSAGAAVGDDGGATRLRTAIFPAPVGGANAGPGGLGAGAMAEKRSRNVSERNAPPPTYGPCDNSDDDGGSAEEVSARPFMAGEYRAPCALRAW